LISGKIGKDHAYLSLLLLFADAAITRVRLAQTRCSNDATSKSRDVAVAMVTAYIRAAPAEGERFKQI
jgi:hypothetical protein